VNEVVDGLPTDYTLHKIEGAKVLNYFFTRYSYFADWLWSNLKKHSSGYKLVFTGHSLGGALAVHAITDIMLENIKSASDLKIYTFGHPRVGNKNFEQILRDRVKDAYWVVHNWDMVAHIPYCVPKVFGST